jgi:hypothetical protein
MPDINEEYQSFLATGNHTHRIGRPPDTQSTFLDYLDTLITQDTLEVRNNRINNNITLTFNDLVPEAKIRFTQMLKNDSSLTTIHGMELTKILEILTIANPFIASNWQGYFCRGSFDRYRERRLSRLIYKLSRRYNPNATNQTRDTINYLLKY